jgi:hypothetical protein
MTPLVDALHDGRLEGPERASLQRHLAACAECRALDADYARFADLVRRPAAETSPLSHRRGRMRVLQAAAVLDDAHDRGSLHGIVAAVTPAATGLRAPALALLVAISMAATGATRSRVEAATGGAAQAAPPSGEPPSLVAVGEAAPPAVTAEQVAPAPSTPAPTAAPAKRAPPRAVTARAAARVSEAGADLAGGVRSLEHGDFGEAVERLSAFRESHPEDPRAEDAAFLTILALDRAGRHEAAAQAARRYLAGYPRGYRRAEAAVVATRTDLEPGF